MNEKHYTRYVGLHPGYWYFLPLSFVSVSGTPVEEGGYGHGRHYWIRVLILLVWSDLRLHGVLLMYVTWIVCDFSWFDFMLQMGLVLILINLNWFLTNYGRYAGCRSVRDNSDNCVLACVRVCVCIMLTNVLPGGFWCSLTLNSVVIMTAALALIALPVMFSCHVKALGRLTTQSKIHLGLPATKPSVAMVMGVNKRGQWEWMEPLSISCWCSKGSLQQNIGIDSSGAAKCDGQWWCGFHYPFLSKLQLIEVAENSRDERSCWSSIIHQLYVLKSLLFGQKMWHTDTVVALSTTRLSCTRQSDLGLWCAKCQHADTLKTVTFGFHLKSSPRFVCVYFCRFEALSS